MSDKTLQIETREGTHVSEKLADMGDGTHARVVALEQTVTVASGPLSTATATIASGASLSAAIDLAGQRAARIAMPATWTAANLTFQASIDGVTYGDLYDKDGIEYTVVAAAAREINLPLVDFLGVRYLKVRSGTSGTPVNQAAERALIIQTVA